MEEVDLSNNRNFIKKPWITLGIAKSCSIKNKLYNKWTRARGSPNEMLAMNSYKSYRSKLKSIIIIIIIIRHLLAALSYVRTKSKNNRECRTGSERLTRTAVF